MVKSSCSCLTEDRFILAAPKSEKMEKEGIHGPNFSLVRMINSKKKSFDDSLTIPISIFLFTDKSGRLHKINIFL